MNVGVFVRFEDRYDFGYFPGSWYGVGVYDPIIDFGDDGYGVIWQMFFVDWCYAVGTCGF